MKKALALALAASLLIAARPPVEPPSITLDQSNVSLGDYVTFTTSDIPVNVKNPRIVVNCYQPTDPSAGQAPFDLNFGFLVFGITGDLTYNFPLGGSSSIWLYYGGPAQCVATLFYFSKEHGQQTYNPLASTEFDAGG